MKAKLDGPRVRGKIRVLNKRVLNPAIMTLAGRRHFPAAVVRHRGRGRVLILESDEDPVTPDRRAELRQAYPQAQVHTFHGAGHAPWMSHKEEYLSVIEEFLDREKGTRT